MLKNNGANLLIADTSLTSPVITFATKLKNSPVTVGFAGITFNPKLTLLIDISLISSSFNFCESSTYFFNKSNMLSNSLPVRSPPLDTTFNTFHTSSASSTCINTSLIDAGSLANSGMSAKKALPPGPLSSAIA